MKRFCEVAIQTLATIQDGREWAKEYVRLRIEFHHKHGHSMILSTWYGIDFFANVLACLNGAECDEPKGEYRTNFLKVISIGKSEA